MDHRKICLMLAMALLIPLGLMAPASAATAPSPWACPPTQSVPPTPTLLEGWFGLKPLPPSGLDKSYMKNLCGLDANAQSPSSVKFSRFVGSKVDGTRVGFLGLPGAFALDDQFGALLPTILAASNEAVFTNYIGSRFTANKPDDVVEQAIRQELQQLLQRNDKVMILGSSTGGPIASLVVSSLTKEEKQRITLELACSPAGKSTLQPQQQSLANLVDFLRLVSGGNTAYAEEPYSRLTLLQIGGHSDYGSDYQFDQALFNAAYQPLASGALKDLARVVYFAVTNDETVDNAAAYEVWKKMRGGEMPLRTVPGGHVNFAANPIEWNAALGQEFTLLAESSPAPVAASPAA